MENAQYSECLSIIGVIQGTFQGELYQELGLESLNDTQW